MSCERYQRLLHLNKSGEISGQDADALRRHVRLCERCALELQRIERADGFTDRLREFSPTPGNPEKLTADVLRRVRAQSMTTESPDIPGRVLDFFLIPSVRYSTVAVVLLVALTLMTQFLSLLSDVSNLEARMASRNGNETTEATYSIQSKTLGEAARSETGKPLRESVSVAVTNGRIDVPVKAVDAFLSGNDVRNLPAMLGTAILQIDRKTLEKIVNEVKATAELTFRVRHEGA